MQRCCIIGYMLSDIRFKDFEDVLATAGSLADAAEAHGSLCGALCSMSPYKMQDWVNEILPDSGSLSEESSAMIERVFTATATSFGEQGMEFEPLLPDDEAPLNGRANALALWCTGFLYGLGTGAISDLEGLNGDVGEIVRIAAPVHLKFGLRNAPNLYPSGAHLEGVAQSTGRERVRRAAIGLEHLARQYPEAIMSPVGRPRPGVPVAGADGAVAG